MIRLLLFFAIFQVADCSCPDGFDLVRNGECRGLYYTAVFDYHDSLNTAIAKCREIQAQPVIIHDEEQQSHWKTLSTYENSTDPILTIGLVCNLNTRKWEWADGSSVDYKPPQGLYDSNLDKACNEGCNWNMWSSGFWNSACAFHKQYTIYVFCTKSLQQPIPSEDGCESFEDDSEEGVCYQIGATTENWEEAAIVCMSFGADLASIHNEKENEFVRRLAVSKGEIVGVFLGASRKGNDFAWIDGSDWDYNNYYPDFPIDGLGDCVVMDIEGTTGHWANEDCSSKQSVACMRKQNYTLPACSAGPWKEGQIIYSPGFPFDASSPCDFLLTVDYGKKIEVEIILLEANSCCDRLIIFESYLGSDVIANLTGDISGRTFKTNSSNFMRVSWQPNGGVNVRGIMIKFRGLGHALLPTRDSIKSTTVSETVATRGSPNAIFVSTITPRTDSSISIIPSMIPVMLGSFRKLIC